MWPIKPSVPTDRLQFPGRARTFDDRAPSTVHSLTDEYQRRNSTKQVDGRLQEFSPYHGLHATAIRIDHGERAKHHNRSGHRVLFRQHRADDQRYRNRCREHAHGVGHCARDHEDDGRESACGEAETCLEQRVCRYQIAVEIARQQSECDNESTNDVAGNDLEKSEIARVGKPRHADERQRRRFTRHDGEEHCPPRDRAIGDKIVGRILLIATDPHAECCCAAEIREQHRQIEQIEAAAHDG